jgi:hypothetical protein
VDAAVRAADAALVKADGARVADAAVKGVGAAPVRVDGVKAADAVVRAVDAAPRVGAARVKAGVVPAKADVVLVRAGSRLVIRRNKVPRVPGTPINPGTPIVQARQPSPTV